MNSSTISCSSGYSEVSEFTIHGRCVVPLVAKQVINIVSVCLTAAAILFTIFFLTKRSSSFKNKNKLAKILIVWGVFHIPFMGLKGVIDLLTDAKPVNSLPMAIFVHLNGVSAALYVSQLGYFLLDTVAAGTIKGKNGKGKEDRMGKWKLPLFGGASLLASILFMVGPFLYHFADVQGALTMWGSIFVADVLLVSMMSVFGFVLYCRMRKMVTTRFVKLTRQLLYTLIVCMGVGISTAVLCVFSTLNPEYEWVITPVVWNSNELFATVIILFLTKPKESKSKHRLNKLADITYTVDTGPTTSSTVSADEKPTEDC